jgi:hypothetical protein
MEIAVALLFAALILLDAACAFFLVVVQPIWGIVDVARSDKHSGGTKTAIILLTLLLLGPIMYSLDPASGLCRLVDSKAPVQLEATSDTPR